LTGANKYYSVITVLLLTLVCVALDVVKVKSLPGVLESIDAKKRFLRLFYFGHVFTFFNVFFIFQTFLFLKNVGKVQSGKQINKKHFQNNSNEIQWVHK